MRWPPTPTCWSRGFAFLEGTADSGHTRVRDGADSFVIEDGWLVAQTIHYTVEPV